jgi:polar amino acid transport system permease protein
MDILGDWLPRLFVGAWLTVRITVAAALLGFVLAFLAGIGMLSRRAPVRVVSRTYTEIFRGVSVLVLMFWFVFSLPLFFDVGISELNLAILALALNIGAYEAEVVRGGIQAVPRGQWEASTALNLSRTQRLRRIIVPQAIGPMIPPLTNLTIQLLKASALVSIVGISDLTTGGLRIRTLEGPASTVPMFTLLLLFYFAIAQVIAYGGRVLERRTRVERV